MPSTLFWTTAALVLLGSRPAIADCVLHGARPVVPLPTMIRGQEFSFIASDDCLSLRFSIQGGALSKVPMSGGPTEPGPDTYKVVLTEREWNAAVSRSADTLTWIVTGTSSAGVTTRLVTTNELGAGITLDLSRADAKLIGEHREDAAGASVDAAGDVDGDGRADVIVGSFQNDEGGEDAGAAYLVLGPVSGTFDLSSAHAKLVGESARDRAGSAVAGAGDTDGDGHPDLLVGAPYYNRGGFHTGAAYLVAGPVTGTVDLSLAHAKLVGELGDYVGGDVSSAGDVDGDGRDDVLVSAPNDDEGGFAAGAAFLVLGGVSGTLDLSYAHAKLVGEEPYDVAYHAIGAGDVDGDGLHDVLMGAYLHPQHMVGVGDATGAAYLLRGPFMGTVDLSTADAKLVGEEGGLAGAGLSGAGDVDGDGLDDVLVGAYATDDGGIWAGAAYVVLGPVDGDVALDTAADATLIGEVAYDYAGMNVAGAGDADADGFDDVLIGAWGNAEGGYTAGAAYVVRGPLAGVLDLSHADVKLVGERRGDRASESLAGAGDMNGDGRDDVIVGAARDEKGFYGAGAAYVILGGGL